MRFGITTPIVTLTPRNHAPWEATAGTRELAEIARAADRLGYHHLTCSEHVGIPVDVAATRGTRYYDPVATLGYLAAHTERIRLVTHVIVLPYHHPLEIAKRYGTLDALSGGRVVLGVGVGSLEPEFKLLGVDFAGRGAVYEDGLRALRAVLGRREPTYAGAHYDIGGFIVDPCAVQEHMPIWLGGRTRRSLRRALVFGDGWDPFGLSLDEIAAIVAAARDWPVWRERREPFEVILAPERIFDVTTPDGRDGMGEEVRKCQAAGATGVNLRFRSTSSAHFVEQLEIFMRAIAPQVAAGAGDGRAL